MSVRPTFSGEMQLAGWSESHTGGCKVTFWLPSPDDLTAFRTLTTRKGNTAGHRFIAALVEIGDDEQPVNQINTSPKHIQKTTENEQVETPKIGPLGYWLVLRCNEPEFWRWLRTIGYNSQNADEARDAVTHLLGIESRKEIDGNAKKESEFHREIRGPYSRWCAARGVTA